MLDAFTIFDAIAVGVVLISAIMAFARGFMREIATLGAFIMAAAAAYFAQKYFLDDLRALLPATAPDWAPHATLVIIAFLMVYVIVAWFGQRLSRNIHGLDGIGMIDHFVGLAFGAARGAAALIFFVLILDLGMEENKVPSFIQDAAVYPHLRTASRIVSAGGEKAVKDMETGLPSGIETRQ